MDDILGGGIISQEISELSISMEGGSSYYKGVEICTNIIISTLSQNFNILYIDTNNNFSAVNLNNELIKKLLIKGSHNREEIKRVKCVKTFDIYKVFDVLEIIHSLLKGAAAGNSGAPGPVCAHRRKFSPGRRRSARGAQRAA